MARNRELERLSLPEAPAGKRMERRGGRGRHFLLELPDGTLAGVWEDELPAFLKRYGQEGPAGSTGR